MGGCGSSITYIEINISTREVLHLGHPQGLWGEMSWYYRETADHEWKKKITSKHSAPPAFHTEGTVTKYTPKKVQEGRKAFENILLENLPGRIFSSRYRALAAPPSPLFSLPCESLLWWDPDRSKARGYKCVTRTDLNPSHIHCVSFCSWEFPGKWNRTFQLYIVYIEPFKKGENLEHSQKLYIKFKRKNQYISLHLHNSAKPHSEILILAHWNRSWSAPAQLSADVIFLTPGGPSSTWMLHFTSAHWCYRIPYSSGVAGVAAESWEKATELLLCTHLSSQRT